MSMLWHILHWIFEIAIWVVIARFAVDLLIQFKILNAAQDWVGKLAAFLSRVTEPALRPIRRFLPAMGGIDISPAILIVLIWLVEWLLFRLLFAGMMMM